VSYLTEIDTEAQPCREQNIEVLVSRLLGSAADSLEGFGVEAAYAVNHADGTPVTFMEAQGLAALFEKLGATYPEEIYNDQDMLQAVQRTNNGVVEIVSYEGDGKLKLSAGPFSDLMAAGALFEDFRALAAGFLDEVDQTIAQQSLTPTGIESLMEHHQKSTDQVGIELEQFILHGDLTRVGYSEEEGIKSLLEALAPNWENQTFAENGDLIGLDRTVDGYKQAITLEPAGQFELSAGPYHDLTVANDQFESFQAELKQVLEPRNQQAISLGYMPVGKAEDMELIPKSRYVCMDKHFRQFGPYGTCMMRGSASTQVSVDFKDEDDCKRKFRLANALGPILALMCCNTMRFEDENCEHIMMRTMMWNGVDRDRCNVAPGTFDDDWTPRTYAEWLLDIPAVCVSDGKGGFTYDERTFGEVYANQVITPEIADHIMSMVFPDVRLKGFIEIRTADSMPLEYAMALAAFAKGLFSTDEAVSQAGDVLGIGHIHNKDIVLAKLAMMEKGYDAQIYNGKKVQDIAGRLHMIAKYHLNRDERKILEPLTTLTMNGLTLAELTDLML
jgi:glutamate--cysteine ligase